jgi:hypothetical protein
MKKFVFTALMALAGMCLVSSNHLRAQDSGQQITISDPAEYNAYQNASNQKDPKAMAKALEDFLTAYPQSVVKKAALQQLIGAYQNAKDDNGTLSAATRLLQIEPGNPQAVFISAYIKKGQCAKTSDAQTCDDAAALAQKGLNLPKPAGTSDDDWKKQTATMYPIFDSTIALDDIVSKKDIKGAIQEYRTELNLYSLADTTKGQGLVDTLQLAEAYAKPDARDMVLACWFYARAWDYAPATYQAQIEPKLEYWYKRYHGNTEGLDALKTAAKATLFPPSDTSAIIKAAPTPAENAHTAFTSGDPATLSLSDKEYILANGNDEDAQALWKILQAQEVTPVPGTVLEAQATVYKVSVTTAKEPAKPQEFVVSMTTPAACDAVPTPPTELKIKDAQAYILANGAKADTDAMGDLLTEEPAKIKKFAIVPAVAVVKVAVTQEAKDAKTADFIVNMKEKEPVSCKDAPKVGSDTKAEPPNQLNATYDKFTKVAASGGNEASAQILMKDGFMGQEEKKTATKPAAGHAASATHKTK